MYLKYWNPLWLSWLIVNSLFFRVFPDGCFSEMNRWFENFCSVTREPVINLMKVFKIASVTHLISNLSKIVLSVWNKIRAKYYKWRLVATFSSFPVFPGFRCHAMMQSAGDEKFRRVIEAWPTTRRPSSNDFSGEKRKWVISRKEARLSLTY